MVAIQASQRPSGDQLSWFTWRRWVSSEKTRTERPVSRSTTVTWVPVSPDASW